MKTIYFLLISILLSCDGNPCGNKQSAVGKYVNDNNKNDINYIILNEDGTYFYFYKKMTNKEKFFRGKWKSSSKKSECQIIFFEWKDIVGYVKLDELSSNYAHHRGDKLMFFEDIDGAEYKKVP